ncbi:MAG: RNA methyltransferase, partial [Spirochaetaceae bacterium]|nr:RNA methyltransferase [Spirochaetaceae bacterium]
KALRASMGNALALPLYSCSQNDLAILRGAGFSLVAAALSETAIPLRQFTPVYPLVLLAGNEGYGLPAEIINLCGTEVMIPMAEGIDSLNVVVAASICMYALFGDPAQQ